MTCLDTSAALAHLPAEDRQPPAALWDEIPVSSRPLEYEIWIPLHRRGIAGSHGEAACGLLGRVALVELAPQVLARVPEAFPGPGPLRTLDALHLASCAYLAESGQEVEFASCDWHMNGTARSMDTPLFDQEGS